VSKVALAYSGGLDSSLSIELLRRKYKVKEIVAINIDVGQGDEEQVDHDTDPDQDSGEFDHRSCFRTH